MELEKLRKDLKNIMAHNMQLSAENKKLSSENTKLKKESKELFDKHVAMLRNIFPTISS